MRSLTPIPSAVREEAAAITERLYGFGNPGAKCYYGSASPLTFWNATHYTDGSRSLIVLHGKFRTRARAGLYRRDEILAHEFVHAFRTACGESVYEEHLAYQTSSSALHRALGGACRSGPQMLALILLLPLALPRELLIRRRFNRARAALVRRGEPEPLKRLVRLTEAETDSISRTNNNKQQKKEKEK